MEARERRKKPTHPISESVAENTSAEETIALPGNQDAKSSDSTTHVLEALAEHESPHSETSTWVRRTTRNVNEVSTDQVLTGEEQLKAALAESLAQASARPAQKGPAKQTRKRQSNPNVLLIPQKEQEAVFQVHAQSDALKRPKIRDPSTRNLIEREVDNLAQSPDINEPTKADDLEQAKELERQRQALSLAMLERQEGQR